MKNKRQAKILELIEQNRVETQEALMNLLRGHGYDVTQATVSRDIKELCLIKDEEHKYVQARPSHESDNSYRSIFIHSIKEIDYALNTVVLKCYTGMAMAACAVLDTMEYAGIVGTIAGDDTIFILMRTEGHAVNLVRELKKLIAK